MTSNQRKAKAILDDIRDADKKIRAKRLKIELMTTRVEGGAIRYDKLNVKTSTSNFTEEMLADIADLEMEIEEDLAQVDTKYMDVYKLIRALKNIDEQNMLYGYYFDGFTYEEMATRMYVSRRTLCRIEDEALEHLGELL